MFSSKLQTAVRSHNEFLVGSFDADPTIGWSKATEPKVDIFQDEFASLGEEDMGFGSKVTSNIKEVLARIA